MDELSKYIKSVSEIINRSQIHFADYNPRTLSEESKKALKRGIKKYGMVGGIVVNKKGYTVVSGHQRLTVMDELQNYPEKDYKIRVDLIDVDEKAEKELNILMNNPNAQGTWDYDKLKELIPQIDYKDAGLTDADLSMIGVDMSFATEANNSTANDLSDFMSNVDKQHQDEIQQRAEEKKIQHVKDVKEQVKEKAMNDAANMDAYVVLSFSNYESMKAFLNSLGYDESQKFIKGEDFQQKVEGFAE